MSTVNQSRFSELLPALGTRAARASVSMLGFASAPLRRHLLQTFAGSCGQSGSFLAEPVLEATFGWRQADATLGELSGKLLEPSLVDALDAPWSEAEGDPEAYRQPRGRRPYVHQLQAWQALLAQRSQSVVVSSGTGSGKTECFMIPVLNGLAAAAQASSAPLEGVQALFLYPLNALIKSQRERLAAWTGPFEGRIRYCLYNGNTPERLPEHKRQAVPHEVLDRLTLRRSPPPILVTNPTMLEYMLVRAQDASILEKSRGTLKWIVLDEAHNYIGSQAAELALLLRRVLHAFGTSADEVRFVATSATIAGDDADARGQLQRFLADLAGVDPSHVMVAEGRRQVPALPEGVDTATAPWGPAELAAGMEGDPDGLYRRLSAHPLARCLRDRFVPAVSGQGWQKLLAVGETLREHGRPGEEADALAWLDLLTSGVHRFGHGDATPFLPLRLHAFHGTLDGLWVCADPGCTYKAGTALADPAWPFGLVHTEERRHCDCGAPAYPLVSCNDCNEAFLEAVQVEDDRGLRLVAPVEGEDIDEFLLDRDPEDPDETAAADADGQVEAELSNGGWAPRRTPSLVVHEPWGHLVALERGSLELMAQPDADALTLRLVLAEEESDGPGLPQCPCCGSSKTRAQQFRRARLGAPFLLGTVIPTLLEFCPDGDKPHESPLRGRRMISFTDSRQGTARIAARLQQEAERTALRAGVYRRLSAEGAASEGAAQQREILERAIQGLKNTLAGPTAAFLDESTCSTLRTTLADKEAQLQQLRQDKPVPYRDLVHWLSTVSGDVSHWVHRSYVQSDRIFKDSTGKELLADILLCREFARRPKRQNSLESMGLVAVFYPKLGERVHLRKPAVEQAGLSLQEWRDFLKLCLDFFVRQQWCLPLPAGWDRWGALRTRTKQLLPPRREDDQAAGSFVRWPRVRAGVRQPMLVQLLARALRLDPLSERGRDLIDALLLAAWDDLVHSAGLLRSGGAQGYYLDRADMAFGHIRRGWLCPVTRRILDTTLRGLTPYQPLRVDAPAVSHCQAVDVPVCGLIEGAPGDPRRVAEARGWIDAQGAIAQARLEGWWSDLNDRVIEGAGYYRAVEHSAQQSSTRLDQYEAQFRRGAINLMSCSTTMEMGVDIGGINMVAMNNVPPHPANYLQRAGRAGRRAETRSVALTLCKNNPHDRHVFRNTEWPFNTPLPTPRILLSSPVLVQRHVNALLLSTFLKRQDREGRLDKLTNEWWMLSPGDDPGPSQQEQFKDWCDSFDPSVQLETAQGLQALVKCTVFEGAALRALASEAGEHARRHAEQWRAEVSAIDEQRAALSKRDPDDKLPLRALEVQRKRLTAEYLLRELASSGFLPGYGFPTDITSFETLNRDSEEIARQREHAEDEREGSREDNRFQRRELPSRDTVTALREYAPGASVVIDGLVYESAGITLNWHVPASEDALNELQNVRYAWRCAHCGASGTHTQPPAQCPECGDELQKKRGALTRYLEPAGFSVDLYERTHNDITQQRYIAPEPPWIAGSGGWMPLSNAALGRFRAGSEGSVFHHSAGPGGRGYAVCLECGRAALMSAAPAGGDSTPKAFKDPHLRLRGRRGRNDCDEVCGGSTQDFKIQRFLSFGREYTTDVLELSLNGIDGRPLLDRTVAYTLAVALRRAIARRLGVHESELGCDSKELRDEAGQRSRVIQVFDMRAAGYCSLVAQDLPELLRAVHDKYLHCDPDCGGACQRCLLSYDTRFRVDDLDRHRALQFLTPQWLDALALPEAQRLLGTASKAEARPLDEALMHALNRAGARRLYVYLHGSPADWDLPGSPLRVLLHRLSAKSQEGAARLCVVTVQADLTALAPADAAVLQGLQRVCGVEVLAGGAPPLHWPGAVLATVEQADGSSHSWATAETALAQPDAYWGRPGAQALVSASTPGPELSPQAPQLPEVAARMPGGRTLEITNQLDTRRRDGKPFGSQRSGDMGCGFGQRFWALLGDGDIAWVLPEGQRVAAVSYEDRYLNTPISCALLVDVISALKARYEPLDGWEAPRVEVATMFIDRPPRGAGLGSAWTAEWPDSARRDAALREAFAYAGIEAQVLSAGKHDLLHGRRLLVSFTDGTRLSIVPDQGWAYWTLDRSSDARLPTSFSLDAKPAELGRMLAEFDADVRGHRLPTLVAVYRG